MEEVKQVDSSTLREWLESDKNVSVVDIRPAEERKEWFIPGSYHIDAYAKLKQHDSHALDDLYLDKKIPVVTVCGGGKTSLIAAEILQNQGYEAYSLKDGMKGWSLAWNQAILNFKDYQIIQLRRTGKGCLSYIIASDKEAIVVDASLSAEVYEKILRENKWILKAVVETHIHADHLSRAKQLADDFKAQLLLPVPNKAAFPYERMEDGQIINVEKVPIKVLSTPGHTIESVCFSVNGEVLLSGDTVFTNAVGRPDLKADEEEVKKRAGLLYDSLQRLMHLNEGIIVLPAHTSMPIDFDNNPIKATLSEIRKNVPMLELDKEAFVNNIISKLPPPPSNYLAIVEKNLAGDFSDINPSDLEAGANRCAVS
jgi:glyoxylase-like metal-dependent hydrolase (beta-lactamase superfamily II)/rhodanese-related sulfurtransferase